jgi:hypothetical protein
LPFLSHSKIFDVGGKKKIPKNGATHIWRFNLCAITDGGELSGMMIEAIVVTERC